MSQNQRAVEHSGEKGWPALGFSWLGDCAGGASTRLKGSRMLSHALSRSQEVEHAAQLEEGREQSEAADQAAMGLELRVQALICLDVAWR